MVYVQYCIPMIHCYRKPECAVYKDDQQTECPDVQYLNKLSQLPTENKTQFVLCPLPPDFLLFSGTSVPIHLFEGAEARDFWEIFSKGRRGIPEFFLLPSWLSLRGIHFWCKLTLGEQVLNTLINLILFKGIIIAILNYALSNASGTLLKDHFKGFLRRFCDAYWDNVEWQST